jgi:hypothetical protein
MDDTELGRLLANQVKTPEPSVESLRAIVARDRRTRVRTFAAVMAITLAIGVVAVGTRLGPDPSTTTEVASADLELASFESDQLAALESGAPGPGQGAPRQGSGPPGPEPLDQLFLRTTGDGVAIRAYRHQVVGRAPCQEGQECPPQPPAACLPAELLLAELSNSGSIGPRHPLPVFAKPAGTTLEVLHAGVFGGRERSPAQWVTAIVGPDVAVVRVTFAGGAVDEMVPVDGYAVLARGIQLSEVPAHGDASPLRQRLSGTVEGLDGSGTVVASRSFAPGDSFSRPEGCPSPPAAGYRGGPRQGPGRAEGPGHRPGGGPRPGPRGPGDGPQGGGPPVEGTPPSVPPQQ